MKWERMDGPTKMIVWGRFNGERSYIASFDQKHPDLGWIVSTSRDGVLTEYIADHLPSRTAAFKAAKKHEREAAH